MSSIIKDSIFKFIFVFLFLFLLGYFIKSLDINAFKALILAATVTCVDTVLHYVRVSKNKNVS